MTPEEADDFISEHGLEAAKSEIGMTQQPGLRAGSLAGQDLSLLKARASTVWSRTRNALCVVQHVEEDVGLHVRWWVAEDGVQLGDVVEAFDYLGERDADGWIAAPEGGWRENPVPGMRVNYDTEWGGGTNGPSDDLAWSSIKRFRPAEAQASTDQSAEAAEKVEGADTLADRVDMAEAEPVSLVQSEEALQTKERT